MPLLSRIDAYVRGAEDAEVVESLLALLKIDDPNRAALFEHELASNHVLTGSDIADDPYIAAARTGALLDSDVDLEAVGRARQRRAEPDLGEPLLAIEGADPCGPLTNRRKIHQVANRHADGLAERLRVNGGAPFEGDRGHLRREALIDGHGDPKRPRRLFVLRDKVADRGIQVALRGVAQSNASLELRLALQ